MDPKLWKKAVSLYQRENPPPTMGFWDRFFNRNEDRIVTVVQIQEESVRFLWYFGFQVKPYPFNSLSVKLLTFTLYSLIAVTLPFWVLGVLFIFLFQFSPDAPPFTTLEFILFMLKFSLIAISILFLVSLATIPRYENFSIRTWEQYLEKAKEELNY